MNIAIFGNSEFTFCCVRALLEHSQRLLLLCPESESAEFERSHMHETGVEVIFFRDWEDPALFSALADFETDYIFSIVCNHLIPETVLKQSRHGSINFHPAPLPEFRSPNAWFWVIRAGLDESAISLHHMEKRFDHGNLVLRHPLSLTPHDTQGTYASRVSAAAPELINALVPLLESPPLPSVEPQGEGAYYPKTTLQDLFIGFSDTAESIDALVRACNPFYPATTLFRRKDLRVLEVAWAGKAQGTPGEIRVEEGDLQVCCGDAMLSLRCVNVPMEGVFTGARFAGLYGVRSGERFHHIQEFPEYQHLLDQ